jgi:hypothetical protein
MFTNWIYFYFHVFLVPSIPMSTDPALSNLEAVKVLVDIISGIALLIGGVLAAFWAYTKFVLERGFLPPSEFHVDCHKVGYENDGHLLEFLIHVKNLGSSALVVSNLRVVDIRYLTSDDPGIKYFTSTKTLQETADELVKIDELSELNEIEISNSEKSKSKKKKETRELLETKDKEIVKTLRVKTAKLGRLIFPHSLRQTIRPDLVYGPNSFSIARSISKKEEELRKARNRREEIEKRGIRILPWDTFVQPGVDQVYSYATMVPPTTKYVMITSSFEYGQIPSRVQSMIIKLSRRLGLIQYSLTHLSEPHTTESVFEIT